MKELERHVRDTIIAVTGLAAFIVFCWLLSLLIPAP